MRLRSNGIASELASSFAPARWGDRASRGSRRSHGRQTRATSSSLTRRGAEAEARTNEPRAMLDHHVAQVNFDTLQQADRCWHLVLLKALDAPWPFGSLRSQVTTGQPEAVRRHSPAVTMPTGDPCPRAAGNEGSRTRRVPFDF